MCDLTQPQFQNKEVAREYLENLRWPNGPVCPHCGTENKAHVRTGAKVRPGLYRCGEYKCRKDFSVTVGTVFERSKVPLNKWLMCAYLMASSKKGISSHQIHRMLGVTYKTAWFMTHRLREAMKGDGGLLGSGGGTVEIDETFWGPTVYEDGNQKRYTKKKKVFTLVERGGKARSFSVPNVQAKTLKPILEKHLSPDAVVYSDNAGQYRTLKDEFPTHESVNHSQGEYVRGTIHTNTVEGYFGLLKRGVYGTFHHVSEQHLNRYVGEFDFRWNHKKMNDSERADIALVGIAGKRLMYRDSSQRR